jgi:hypothetical protein
MTNRVYETAMEQIGQCYSYAFSYTNGSVKDEEVMVSLMNNYWSAHQEEAKMEALRNAMEGLNPSDLFKFYLRIVVPYMIACNEGKADLAYNVVFTIPKIYYR